MVLRDVKETAYRHMPDHFLLLFVVNVLRTVSSKSTAIFKRVGIGWVF